MSSLYNDLNSSFKGLRFFQRSLYFSYVYIYLSGEAIVKGCSYLLFGMVSMSTNINVELDEQPGN